LTPADYFYGLVSAGFAGFIVGIVAGELGGMYFGWEEGGFPFIHLVLLAGAVGGLFIIPVSGSLLLGGTVSGAMIGGSIAYAYGTFHKSDVGTEIFMSCIVLGAAASVGAYFIMLIVLPAGFLQTNPIFYAGYVGVFLGLLIGTIVGVATKNRSDRIEERDANEKDLGKVGCPNCGTKNQRDEKTCSVCGESLST